MELIAILTFYPGDVSCLGRLNTLHRCNTGLTFPYIINCHVFHIFKIRIQITRAVLYKGMITCVRRRGVGDIQNSKLSSCNEFPYIFYFFQKAYSSYHGSVIQEDDDTCMIP